MMDGFDLGGGIFGSPSRPSEPDRDHQMMNVGGRPVLGRVN